MRWGHIVVANVIYKILPPSSPSYEPIAVLISEIAIFGVFADCVHENKAHMYALWYHQKPYAARYWLFSRHQRRTRIICKKMKYLDVIILQTSSHTHRNISKLIPWIINSKNTFYVCTRRLTIGEELTEFSYLMTILHTMALKNMTMTISIILQLLVY